MNETPQKIRNLTRYISLLKRLRPYMEKGDTDRLRKAFRLAEERLEGNMAEGGRSLLTKSLMVGQILAGEMGMGPDTVMAVFLYELINAEKISTTESQQYFGQAALSIAEGLVSVNRLNLQKISIESDNFQKMLLSMTPDIRALLIRMANTVYELRHLSQYPSAAHPLIIRKAKSIYIPFAHRLGLYNIKTQLEELCMQHADPSTYRAIAEQIRESQPKQEALFNDFIRPLQRSLTDAGMECIFKWRFKSIPSIWHKMQKQGVGMDQIYDLFAVRIILIHPSEDEKAACWKVYSIVSNIYTPDASRLRDWITQPRPSGYESLHTTVKTPEGRTIEVQIRTQRMDDIAEKGDAAHWKYKETGKSNELDTWLRDIRNILEDRSTPTGSRLDEQIISKPSSHIFVMTPHGDVKQLPYGASVLDFAFEVHSTLGSSCTGARVNQKVVPIKHILTNGDTVEIITSKNQFPKLDWLQYCITGNARSRIRRALNEDRMKEAELGKTALQRRLRNWKIPYDEELIDRLLRHFKMKTALDLYSSLNREEIDWQEVKKTASLRTDPSAYQPPAPSKKNRPLQQSSPGDAIVIGQGSRNLGYVLAKCCSPIHGDEVFGFVTISKGITIHRKNCPNAASLISRHGYRVVEAHWQENASSGPYQSLLRITGDDRLGLLADLTRTLTDEMKINILSVSLDSSGGFFDGKLKIVVKDRYQLDQVIHKLLKVKGVARVKRYYD